jgi:hypothetical protein
MRCLYRLLGIEIRHNVAGTIELRNGTFGMNPRPILIVIIAALCGLSWTGLASPTYESRQEARQSKQTETPVTCELSDEDYAVFTSVLQGLGKPEDPEEQWRDKQILVLDVTEAGQVEPGQWKGWGFRSNSKAAPSSETRKDFEVKARDQCPLKENWGDTKSYSRFENKEYRELFEEKNSKPHDGWMGFYTKHPKAGGIWSFSRPGYNNRKDEAVLYVTHSCGWLCGTGHLYLLTKEHDQWKVKNRLFLWISQLNENRRRPEIGYAGTF